MTTLTQTQIITLVFIWGFIAIEVVLTLWVLHANRTLLKVTESSSGAKTMRSFRCRPITVTEYKLPSGLIVPRLPKQRLFRRDPVLQNKIDHAQPINTVHYARMFDFAKRRAIKVKYGPENTYIMEGKPFIGLNRVLFVNYDNKRYEAYSISKTIPSGYRISNNLMAWIYSSRHELYEETKRKLTNAEIFTQVVLPLGLIVLALSCLIFFPKIYAAIMKTGNQAAQTASSNLANILKGMLPQ